jgi:hypothetical protein
MVAPLGGVVGGSDSVTIEFEDDVDGGAPGGLPAGLAASTTEF